MGAREYWFYIDENDMLHEVSENDGAVYLRSGPERDDTILCSVEEAKTRYPEKLSMATRRG